MISTKNSGGGKGGGVGGKGSPQSVIRSLRFLKAKIGAVIEQFQSVRCGGCGEWRRAMSQKSLVSRSLYMYEVNFPNHETDLGTRQAFTRMSSFERTRTIVGRSWIS